MSSISVWPSNTGSNNVLIITPMVTSVERCERSTRPNVFASSLAVQERISFDSLTVHLYFTTQTFPLSLHARPAANVFPQARILSRRVAKLKKKQSSFAEAHS